MLYSLYNLWDIFKIVNIALFHKRLFLGSFSLIQMYNYNSISVYRDLFSV